MSRVGISEGAAVQNGVKECDEFTGRQVRRDQSVNSRGQPLRCCEIRRQRPDCRLQVRHQQRRRQSFADHIADGDSEPLPTQADQIQIIAAHLLGRPPCHRDIETG